EVVKLELIGGQAPRRDGTFKRRMIVADTLKELHFSRGPFDCLDRQFADSVHYVAYTEAGLLCLLAHVGKHLGIDIVDEFHSSSGLGANLLERGLELGSGRATNTSKLRLDAVSHPLESEELQHVAAEP